MEVLDIESQHTDTRRRIIQLLTADIKQVNVYEAKKDSCLGDHYHKDTTEYFYILKGTATYNDSIELSPGTLFKVSPPERHMIRCITNVKLMTFLTRPYTEEDSDIYS